MSDLPEGFRWATEAEMGHPEAIIVTLTVDSTGRPYTQGEADVAVPIDADLDLWCAECGTRDADYYAVTFVGPDPKTDRTEVCVDCHNKLKETP